MHGNNVATANKRKILSDAPTASIALPRTRSRYPNRTKTGTGNDSWESKTGTRKRNRIRNRHELTWNQLTANQPLRFMPKRIGEETNWKRIGDRHETIRIRDTTICACPQFARRDAPATVCRPTTLGTVEPTAATAYAPRASICTRWVRHRDNAAWIGGIPVRTPLPRVAVHIV